MITGAAWRRRTGGATLAVALLGLLPAPAWGQQIPDTPQLRWEFFYQKRAFPFGRIPPRALELARGQLAALRLSLNAAPPPVSGTQWSPIGPEGIPINLRSIGRLTAIAVHPTDPNTIYVGGAQGGVWKSTDGGGSWLPLTDRECSLAMGALAIDPVDPEIVYAGTGEQHFSGDSYYGCGLLRSTNGGTSWTRFGGSIFQTASGGARISRVVVDPRGAGTPGTTRVFVASDRGLYRSGDGGTTLAQVLGGIVTDLVMDPSNPDVLYAGVRGTGVFKSVDGGTIWVQRSFSAQVQRINLAIAPSSPAVLYASAEAGSGGLLAGIWRTPDGANTWIPLAATGASCGSQCWYDQVIAVAPNDPNIVYFGGVSLFKSTNGGASFSTITNGIHVDQHALAFHPADPQTVFAGNDGGIFRSVNGGGSWSSLNTTLALTQFYEGISLHPWNPSAVLGGTQDNGTLAYAGLPLWDEVLGGDGGYTAIDFQNPGTWYAETQWDPTRNFSGPQRSDGGFFMRLVNGINTSDRALFIPPLEMDPIDPRTLYFGTYRIYHTIDRADTWTPISPDLTVGGAISAIAPAAGNRLYVGTSDGQVQTTDNGGLTWTPRAIPSAGPRYVQHIAVDPGDPLTAYVAVSGFSTPHVFRTANGGATFQNVSGNLPDVPVNAVVLDPASRGVVLIGTDLGVFASSDSGGSWTPLTSGMPNVAVFDLAYNPGTGVLAAATHGRGMFTLQLNRPLTVAMVPGARRDSAFAGDTASRTDSALVIVTGPGAATTGWTATHTAAGWITVLTPGGTGTGMVRWRRDPTGLGTGVRVDTITVTVPGDAEIVVDSFVVLPGISLPAASTRTEFSGAASVTVSAAVQVWGAGAATVPWSATHGGGAWLTLTTAAGTGSGTLRWQLDAGGLAAGAYVDTLVVVTPRADTARLVSTFQVAEPAVETACATQDLLGTSCLDETRRRFLDLEGNRDGVYNLGDLLALLARSGGAITAGRRR